MKITEQLRNIRQSTDKEIIKRIRELRADLREQPMLMRKNPKYCSQSKNLKQEIARCNTILNERRSK